MTNDKIAGYLTVGLTERGDEVVINHPDLNPDENGVGHISILSQSGAKPRASPTKKSGRDRRTADLKHLAIDLFCGLGGWTEGLLAEGYDVIGFDIERRPYPAQLVLQDVTTLHGSQFRNAALIVASPPCQAYSYRAMPWKRAKALPPPDNTLFDACFRIQSEASEAAGRYIPLVVENVRGARNGG